MGVEDPKAEEAQEDPQVAAEAAGEDDQAAPDEGSEAEALEPIRRSDREARTALIPLDALEVIPGHVHPEGIGQPVLNLERLQAAAEKPAKGEARPPWVATSGGLKAVRQAIQVIERVRCPSCRATTPDIRCERGGNLRYYRCRVCVDPTTGNYTRFKVAVRG